MDYHAINKAYEDFLENEWERLCEDPKPEPDPYERADAMRGAIDDV